MAGDPDRTVVLWRRLASVQRQVARDLDRTLREGTGFPANWIDTLIALAGTPEGRQQMKDLAVQLGMARSGVSDLANQMSDAGLIRREPHPIDQRGC